jgi:hypothetical protein
MVATIANVVNAIAEPNTANTPLETINDRTRLNVKLLRSVLVYGKHLTEHSELEVHQRSEHGVNELNSIINGKRQLFFAHHIPPGDLYGCKKLHTASGKCQRRGAKEVHADSDQQ